MKKQTNLAGAVLAILAMTVFGYSQMKPNSKGANNERAQANGGQADLQIMYIIN